MPLSDKRYLEEQLMHAPEAKLSSPLRAALVLMALTALPSTSTLNRDLCENIAHKLRHHKLDPLTSAHSVIAALILCAIGEHRPDLLDGATLASFTKQLISLESQPGGPYVINGILDPGFNAVVARFLKANEISLPELDAYLESVIASGNATSTFFPPALLAYLLACVCPESQKLHFIETLRAQSIDVQTDALSAAWIVTSLCRLGASAESIAPHVAALQALEEEHLPSSTPLFTSDYTAHMSSPIVTAAFIYEACARGAQSKAAPAAPSPSTTEESNMMARIMARAEQRFATLDPDLHANALREIDRTMRGNTDRQMSLMAYFFRQALGERGTVFPNDTIADLGLANVYFWTAFIIYDNFWDEDEEAIPSVLPTANLYAREFTTFFQRLLPDRPDFQEFVQSLMDRLDGANTWETLHCRTTVTNKKFVVPALLPDFGTYERKYEPASAHILGPVAMLCQMGYAIDSAEVQNLIAYFRNYLIPMQVNDDLHDWEEDMARGNLSSVVCLLLEDYGAKPGDVIDLEKDLSRLKETYWFTTLPRGCALIRPFLERSHAALAAMETVADRAPLAKYIERIERSIDEAERAHRRSADFLTEFTHA